MQQAAPDNNARKWELNEIMKQRHNTQTIVNQ